MEKRWDNVRPSALQIIGAGIIVAGSVLLLPALDFTMRVLAKRLGVMIGEAVGASLRALFSALGVFLPPHPGPETRVPSTVNQFRDARLMDASRIIAAIQTSGTTNRISGIGKKTKRSRPPERRSAPDHFHLDPKAVSNRR
jgi:hypothetical protein